MESAIPGTGSQADPAGSQGARSLAPRQDGSEGGQADAPPHTPGRLLSIAPLNQFDLGSIKKKKFRRTFRRLDLEKGDEDEQFLKDALWYGRERPFSEDNRKILERHLLVRSGLKESNSIIERTGGMPDWTKYCDEWLASLISCGGRDKGVVRNGKIRSFAVDAAFIYLPLGLRPTYNDASLPDFCQWDPDLPKAFFNCMSRFLGDNGYAAILHAGDYQHIHGIMEGVRENGQFKILSSYSILLEEPFFKAKKDFSVSFSHSSFYFG